MPPIATGFVAYPYLPHSVVEVIRGAIPTINSQNGLELASWEDLAIGGRQIIDEVCKSIDRGDVFIADLTGFNLNVLYELGYAIGRNRRVWLLFDSSLGPWKWADFRLLSGIGFRSSISSEEVIRAYAKDRPQRVGIRFFLVRFSPSLRPWRAVGCFISRRFIPQTPPER